MMTRKWKKYLALMLSIMMLCSSISLNVLAAGDEISEVDPTITTETTDENTIISQTEIKESAPQEVESVEVPPTLTEQNIIDQSDEVQESEVSARESAVNEPAETGEGEVNEPVEDKVEAEIPKINEPAEDTLIKDVKEPIIIEEHKTEPTETKTKGTLTLNITSEGIQTSGGVAKIKVSYGLSEDCTVQAVEARLYVTGNNLEAPQFIDGSFTAQGKTFTMVKESGSLYIFCVLNPGDNFLQEFQFVDSDAEAGSEVTFQAEVKAMGELPISSEVQQGKVQLGYIVPEAAVIEDQQKTEEGVDVEQAEEATEYTWQMLLVYGPVLTMEKENRELDEEEQAILLQYEELVFGKGSKLAARAMFGDSSDFTEEEQAVYEAYQKIIADNGVSRPIMMFAMTRAVTPSDLNGKVVSTSKENNSDGYAMPLLEYFSKASDPKDTVENSIKYVSSDTGEEKENDPAYGKRVAYCTDLNKTFAARTDYTDVAWDEDELYSKISYAVSLGCKYFGKASESQYTTGNWIEDYYITQTVIYCILYDASGDTSRGHAIDNLVANTAYSKSADEMLEIAKKMYEEVNTHFPTGQGYTGYDEPSFAITEGPLELKYDRTMKAYTALFDVTITGEAADDIPDVVNVTGAEEARIEMVSQKGYTKTYRLVVPAEGVKNIDQVECQIAVDATRVMTKSSIYITKDSTKQSITFFETEDTVKKDGQLSVWARGSTANVQVSVEKTGEKGELLSGAVFGVYADDALTEKLGTLTTGEKGVSEKLNINIGYGKVYIKEEIAPVGYALNPMVEEIELGSVENVLFTHHAVDCHTVVQITKYFDSSSGKEYKLKDNEAVIFHILTDADNPELVKEVMINSETNTAEVYGLAVGDYILREISAPAGFVKSEDQKFTVTDAMEETGENEYAAVITKVEVTNCATEIEISKQDETGKELSGAALALYDASGEIAVTVYGEELQWVTGEAPKTIEGLAAGAYTLKEVEAPEGYAYAEDIVFEVKEEAGVQKIVMIDTAIKVIDDDKTEEDKKDTAEDKAEDGKKDAETVKSGDNQNVTMYLLLSILALTVMLAAGIDTYRKRR